MDILINFNLTSSEIKKIGDDVINTDKEWLHNIKKKSDISAKDFLESYLYKLSKFDYIHGVIIFLQYVSPDKKIRDASSEYELKITRYFMDFYKSEENYNLFKILKKIKSNKDGTQKLINNILKLFEFNGNHLSTNKKKIFEVLDKKLLILENKFSKNIMEGVEEMTFTLKDLQNIDDETLKSHKKHGTNDKYVFNTSYPDKATIMKECSVQKTRIKMNNTFESVAKQNLGILKDIINIKYKISKILGYKNTSDYYFSDNRLASKKDVNRLISKILPILKKKANVEYEKILNISNKKELYEYDMAYYTNMYKKRYLDINDNIIKEYFPSDYTIPKILDIYAKLFGIDIIQITTFEKYDYAILLYKVYDKNEVLGYIYLDLYPRDGKYTHAATFTIQNTYINKNNERVIPATAIVCNFNPSKLLSFDQVCTFCHELGHALHIVLSKVFYESFAGASTEIDFVEAPSQFFEFWCYDTAFLKNISSHYKTHKSMPIKYIENIKKNKYYNIGLNYLSQILFIEYDLIIHGQKSVTEKYLRDLWFNISENLFPYKIERNTWPMCRFDHLVGYSSAYYSYLWSIIYSYDIFSVFEKNGIFNKKVGMKFRKMILEKGGSSKGTDMLKSFLGRKYNSNRFLQIFS